MWTRGRPHSARRCSMNPGRGAPWDGSIIGTFLDTHALERARASLFFQTRRCWKRSTAPSRWWTPPGHVRTFPPKQGRIMPVLDCAVLVISGTDGVQAHLTLWRLLERWRYRRFVSQQDGPAGMGKEGNCWPNCGGNSAPPVWISPASPEEITGKTPPCATRRCWKTIPNQRASRRGISGR